MRDLFTALFLTVLAFLLVGNSVAFPREALPPLYFSFFLIAILFCICRQYFVSYGCLIIAFSLLISGHFLSKKEKYQIFTQSVKGTEEYVDIRGRLSDYPEIRNDSFILIIQSQEILVRGKTFPLKHCLRIKIMGHDPGLNRGDRVIIGVMLFPLRKYCNFGPDPMENYYLVRDIHMQGICKSPELIEVIKHSGFFWQLIGHWRNRIRSIINRRYQSSRGLAREGVFLEAIILGDRGRLENETEEELIRSGVLHIIAISGANIGMVAWMSLKLLGILHLKRRQRYLIASLILILFLIISGFDISAQRAVFMVLLLFVSQLFYRKISFFSVISFSGLLILISNPLYCLDPGFILTYGLTFGILLGWRIFSHWFNRLPKLICELLTSTLTAGIVAFPLSLYFFSRYSFSGIFSGLILIPLSVLVTGAGLLLIPISLIAPFFGHLVLFSIDPVLKLFFLITSLISRYAALDIYRYSPNLLPTVYLFFIFTLLAFGNFSTLIRKILIGSLLLILIPNFRVKPAPREHLKVYFLDVGQGDCEVIVFPTGDGLLIDGGGSAISDFPIGTRIVLPFLLKQKIRIRWIMISHFHPDHVKGILDLLPILRPEEVWIGVKPEEDEYYREFIQIKPKKTKIVCLGRDWNRKIGFCSICVFSPVYGESAMYASNNQSLVCQVNDKYHSFLFSGDIEKAVEMKLVQFFSDRLKSDILKIAHHGSISSTSMPFIEKVHPSIAVISVSQANSFGFPHPIIVSRFLQRNIPLFSTAIFGGISIESLSDKLKVDISKVRNN